MSELRKPLRSIVRSSANKDIKVCAESHMFRCDSVNVAGGEVIERRFAPGDGVVQR